MKLTVQFDAPILRQLGALIRGAWLDFRLATVNQTAPFVPELVLARRRMHDILKEKHT